MSLTAQFRPDERRGAGRRRLSLGIVTSGDAAGLATVRDLSKTGMLLETAEPLEEGVAFTLDLPEAGSVEAEVVWSSAPLHGCRFSAPLSPAALAAAQLKGDAPADPAGPSEGFGERLHRLRTERGLSLSDIAQRLGVSKPTVWAWEHGKSRPVERRLVALAEALGITPGGLEPANATPPQAIERARARIAEAYGVSPASVRIMIEL